MVLYSESWRSRMRTGNKTIEKQTQYCKQNTPLFLSLIHLSDGAFDAMGFRTECHHLICGQWQQFFFKRLKFWNGYEYGHTFATAPYSFLLEWSLQHIHIQNTRKPSLCLLPRTAEPCWGSQACWGHTQMCRRMRHKGVKDKGFHSRATIPTGLSVSDTSAPTTHGDYCNRATGLRW